jgi:O-antigen/teichoic acid export membrane protein
VSRAAASSEAQPQGGSALARLARNGAMTASADIVAKVLSVVFFSLVARNFSGDTLGHYVFAQAVASLIWSFAGLGLDRMATRDIAKDPQVMRRIAVPQATLKCGSAMLAVVVVSALLAIGGESTEGVVLTLMLGTSTALGLASATAITVFVANERMDHVVLAKLPFGLTSTAAGIAAILMGGGIVLAAFISTLLGTIATGLWAWWVLLRDYGRPQLNPRIREWPGMLREALPFGLQEMLGQVIFRFDTVLLAALATASVVGEYGAAYRMLEAVLFIAWSVGFSVMPMYSYMPVEDGRERLTRVVEGSIKLVVLVMAPIATAFFVLASPLVDFLYGLPEHQGAVDDLRLLAPALAIYGFGHLLGLLVLVRRPGRYTILLSAFVTVANVVACGVLIPLLEAKGAAISTLIAESLLAVGGLLLCRSIIGLPRLHWILTAPLAACAVMAFVMHELVDHLWPALLIGGVAYVVALLAFEAPTLRRDIALFRDLRASRPEVPVAYEEPLGL